MTSINSKKSLKDRTITGILWSSVQRFGTLIISFIVNLVLARLLTPEDFGIIGMLMVFIALASTLIEGGFASALIQKKAPTQEDYSTVFFWNLILSVILFSVLFLSAPAVASFYRLPLLGTVLRVQGIILLFNALNIIQINILRKQLNFKRLAQIGVSAMISGSIVGITMALMGFGVWSLVSKMIFISFFQSIILWSTCRWRPSLVFSRKSFTELFKFGSLMLVSTFTNTLAFQFQSLVIGRVFSASALGYYTQARNVQRIPEQSIPQLVDQVMFPVYSAIQDNTGKVVRAIKRSLKALVFLNFPLMLLLVIIAEPLFLLLLTEKWIDSVPYFQIFCFGGMLFSLNSNNVNVIKAMGKSNYILISTMIKRSITLLFIFIGLQYGMTGVAVGYSLSMYFWFPVNSFFTGKLTGYGFLEQMRDIGFNYLLSFGVAVLTYIISSGLEWHFVLKMFFQISLFSSFYILFAWLFGIDGYKIYFSIINERFVKPELLGYQSKNN